LHFALSHIGFIWLFRHQIPCQCIWKVLRKKNVCYQQQFSNSRDSPLNHFEGSIVTETFVSIHALKVLKVRSARAPVNESREIAGYVIARYCKAIKRGNESKWWTYHRGSKHSAERSPFEMQNSCPKITRSRGSLRSFAK